MQGPPKWTGHTGEFWQNMVRWRKKWQATPVFLLQEPYKQYVTAKRYDARKWTFQVWRYPICYWRREEGITIDPERMEWLGQSRNDFQLWMCQVVKVKADLLKNNILKNNNLLKHNITEEPGMLSPWFKVNWMWSSRIWQETTSMS